MSQLDMIYAKLPHAGKMRLLEQILAWDEVSICCSIVSHRWVDNPLRRCGSLGCMHAVEYAAQAAAIHGVLCNVLDDRTVLLLAAVRDLRLEVERIDNLIAPLEVYAELRARSGPNAIYEFTLKSYDTSYSVGTLTLMQGVGPFQ